MDAVASPPASSSPSLSLSLVVVVVVVPLPLLVEAEKALLDEIGLKMPQCIRGTAARTKPANTAATAAIGEMREEAGLAAA
jgi:hypothetical protein